MSKTCLRFPPWWDPHAWHRDAEAKLSLQGCASTASDARKEKLVSLPLLIVPDVWSGHGGHATKEWKMW